MSPISRRSMIVVLLLTAVLTAAIALPLQAAPYASPVPPPVTCSGSYYRVHYGDTLASIAARFGVSLARLASCNGITNVNRIFAGRLLVIPGGHIVPPPPPPPGGACGVYTVHFGDTLSSIARRFGVSVWTLASVNGIHNINFVWAGQHLRIPCGGDHGFPPPPMHGGWYRVCRGDTVSSIAARFGESTWEIINANGLHFPYTIYVGQMLRIPA